MSVVQLIGTMMFALLISIAALHVAWGFGVVWPAKDERQLVSWVVGAKGARKMPPAWLCVVTGLFIAFLAFVALSLGNAIASPFPQRWVTMMGVLSAFAFFGRGLAAYFPSWRRRFPQEPFATFDQYNFAPLCLLLAAGYAALVILRINP